MGEKEMIENLLSFIQNSPSPFHAVNQVKRQLLNDGFKEIFLSNPSWSLNQGGKYFCIKDGSSLMAMVIGSKFVEQLVI